MTYFLGGGAVLFAKEKKREKGALGGGGFRFDGQFNSSKKFMPKKKKQLTKNKEETYGGRDKIFLTPGGLGENLFAVYSRATTLVTVDFYLILFNFLGEGGLPD